MPCWCLAVGVQASDVVEVLCSYVVVEAGALRQALQRTAEQTLDALAALQAAIR